MKKKCVGPNTIDAIFAYKYKIQEFQYQYLQRRFVQVQGAPAAALGIFFAFCFFYIVKSITKIDVYLFTSLLLYTYAYYTIYIAVLVSKASTISTGNGVSREPCGVLPIW